MKKKGFTLIELLIVIIIIGILAVIVVGLVATNASNRANDAAAKAGMREIQNAVELYRVENDAYPAAITTPGVNVTQDVSGADYMARITYTPTGNCYTLRYDLLNDADSGPNIANGVMTLNCKQ